MIMLYTMIIGRRGYRREFDPGDVKTRKEMSKSKGAFNETSNEEEVFCKLASWHEERKVLM